MVKEWIARAEAGEPVWLDEVRAASGADPGRVEVMLQLTLPNGAKRDFACPLPPWRGAEERAFVADYLRASVYNTLAALGGRELRFYVDREAEAARALLSELEEAFQLRRAGRRGYGKCVNVADRINAAFGAPELAFAVADWQDYVPAPLPADTEPAGLAERLRRAAERTHRCAVCGIDVGGTDVKVAGALEGRLVCLKEYDWDPASSPDAEGILAPLVLLTRLTRAALAAERAALEPEHPVRLALAGAMERQSTREDMERAVLAAEALLGERIDVLDGVGVSFPDVVIQNRIVGGETPKTKGIRENPRLDYRREFGKVTALRELLLPLCRDGGAVELINDGPMAAYTAAMELAHGPDAGQIAGGVLAHSLGTDLGTGWLTAEGQVPEVPMEIYDFILDLGSRPGRALPPEDVRSVRNENSGLPGLRRYVGQAAAFRLAALEDEGLLEGFARREGERLTVPTWPRDLRKPCLEHLMLLAERGEPRAEEIFRRIGGHLGRVCLEMEFLFHPRTADRFLFGRFIKHPKCFALLAEGCAAVAPHIRLVAADDELACTPLMEQLSAWPGCTVAQFAQAVGAAYYCLLREA